MKPLLCILLLFFISGCTDEKPLDTVYDIKENINVTIEKECISKHSDPYDYYYSGYIDQCDGYSIYVKISNIDFEWSLSDFSVLMDLKEAAIQSGNEKKVKKYNDYLKDFSNFHSEIKCTPESEVIDVSNDSVHFDCTYNKEYSDKLGIKVINTSFDLPMSEIK